MPPLSDSMALQAIAALDEAAHAAVAEAKADKRSVWLAQARHSHTIHHTGTGNGAPSGTYTLCQSSLLAWQSINALQNVIEGLIRLAAWQHNQGIALLESGLEFRHTYLVHNCHGKSAPMTATEQLLLEGLPALREFRKVRSCIGDRVIAGMVADEQGADYVAKIVDVFESVGPDIADALEEPMVRSRFAAV